MAERCQECEALKKALLEASVEQVNAETALMNYRVAFGRARENEVAILAKMRELSANALVEKVRAHSKLLEHGVVAHPEQEIFS